MVVRALALALVVAASHEYERDVKRYVRLERGARERANSAAAAVLLHAPAPVAGPAHVMPGVMPLAAKLAGEVQEIDEAWNTCGYHELVDAGGRRLYTGLHDRES